MTITPHPDGDNDVDERRGIWRSLNLIGPTGRAFLRRRGIDLGAFGVYRHNIDEPDPGLDLHDHPWPFVTIILRGGYSEEVADAREAVHLARIADRWPGSATPGVRRHWRRWSVHRIRMTEAHRITAVADGTVTLVLRGRKSRSWGFYTPDGYVDHRRYDYATRRPVTVERSS